MAKKPFLDNGAIKRTHLSCGATAYPSITMQHRCPNKCSVESLEAADVCTQSTQNGTQ